LAQDGSGKGKAGSVHRRASLDSVAAQRIKVVNLEHFEKKQVAKVNRPGIQAAL
jgi:hypothetical protein